MKWTIKITPILNFHWLNRADEIDYLISDPLEGCDPANGIGFCGLASTAEELAAFNEIEDQMRAGEGARIFTIELNELAAKIFKQEVCYGASMDDRFKGSKNGDEVYRRDPNNGPHTKVVVKACSHLPGEFIYGCM